MSNGIAPHEGKELEMVLTGDKPLGSLSYAKFTKKFGELSPTSSLQLCIAFNDGNVVFSLDMDKIHEYLGVLASSEWYIEELGLEEYQRRMGKIFGYSEQEVQAFIDGNIECDCKDCKGMSRKPAQKQRTAVAYAGENTLSRLDKTLKVRNNQFTLPLNRSRPADTAHNYESIMIQEVDKYGRWL